MPSLRKRPGTTEAASRPNPNAGGRGPTTQVAVASRPYKEPTAAGARSGVGRLLKARSGQGAKGIGRLK